MIHVTVLADKVRSINTTTDIGSIKGKQLDLCEGNIIYCYVNCFCLQEKI